MRFINLFNYSSCTCYSVCVDTLIKPPLVLLMPPLLSIIRINFSVFRDWVRCEGYLSLHGIIASLNNAFQLAGGESYAQILVYNICLESKHFHETKYVTFMLAQSAIQTSNYPFSSLPFTNFLLWPSKAHMKFWVINAINKVVLSSAFNCCWPPLIGHQNLGKWLHYICRLPKLTHFKCFKLHLNRYFIILLATNEILFSNVLVIKALYTAMAILIRTVNVICCKKYGLFH